MQRMRLLGKREDFNGVTMHRMRLLGKREDELQAKFSQPFASPAESRG
jgi:hypothetical protein